MYRELCMLIMINMIMNEYSLKESHLHAIIYLFLNCFLQNMQSLFDELIFFLI